MERLIEIQARKAEIKALLESNDEANLEELRNELDSLDAEVRKINEEIELAERKAQEEAKKQRKIAQQINNGDLKAEEIQVKGDNKMENVELRNTPEYGKAFVQMVMTGKDDEVRSLLSTNAASGGVVPVPELLETEIKNAWDECKLMGLVKKTNYKGNVKVGFELSATGAVVHAEGDNAADEEVLTWGTVELKAQSIKKWITISDEAIDDTTIDTLGEVYREIAQRIAEKAEDMIVAKIVAAPATSNSTACGVPKHTAATLDKNMITEAVALTSGKARNITLVMSKRTHALLKGIARGTNYAQDIFDSYNIVFTDALKDFDDATLSTGDTYLIAGDFGYGFQCNFPAANDMTLKVDELSLAEKDLVKIVGRQYVGMGVVAPKAFVKIVK